ncbi:hypothetical protein STENM327S_08378 [Streptomyces tendae]
MGQRVKGAHSPFSAGSAAVAVPSEAKAPSAVSAETVASRVRVEIRGMVAAFRGGGRGGVGAPGQRSATGIWAGCRSSVYSNGLTFMTAHVCPGGGGRDTEAVSNRSRSSPPVPQPVKAGIVASPDSTPPEASW